MMIAIHGDSPLSVSDVLLGFSAFSVGIAAYLAVVNLRAAIRGDLWGLAYAGARISYAGVVALVAEAIMRRGGNVEAEWRVILYDVFLALGAAGLLGVALHHRYRERERRHGGRRRVGD